MAHRRSRDEHLGHPQVTEPPTPSSLAETRSPRSPGELFAVFNRMALQGFGGVLPVAQRELVEQERWLTREQFVELLATCQVLPGPNIVNLAVMLGDRAFGLRGALAALAGMLAMPTLIVLALAAAYVEFANVAAVAGALRGMGAVAAGLIIATALKLASTLRTNRLGVAVAAALTIATALAIGWLRWPLLWVLAALGSLAVAVAWRCWRVPPA